MKEILKGWMAFENETWLFETWLLKRCIGPCLTFKLFPILKES
nr:hypothetical protein BAR15_180021 [Bartonella sp. AR 15-3]CBI79811.1 hypothetical protein BAR15_180043 [Bartonella sp. AR 15-3]